MEEKDFDYFKEKLLQKKTELISLVQKSEDYGREAESNEEGMDIVDKASSSYTKEFMFSRSNSDRQFLAMVNEALDRISSHNGYGICMNCEEEVGRKRLEAVPWAKLCRDCQELQEQGRL